MRYVKQCKDQLRKRWINEYLRALDERHRNLPTSSSNCSLDIGTVVLIKDSLTGKAKWKTGRVVEKVIGKDGVTRGYKVKIGNGNVVERPVQLVSDLEIGGQTENKSAELKANAPAFEPQRVSSRQAKTAAIDRIYGVSIEEDEDL